MTYAARRPWVPRREQFFRWASAALGGATRRRIVISIRVVGERRSRTLNARYRHKDRPTNVLSFEGPGRVPEGRNYLGELVICAPLVAREARAQDKRSCAHWAHLTVHGVLHLLGFDHERRAEARRMAAREIQILDRLGFSNPYA
ncbi:MAG TPA: rRNA maturation RNase YbeY [Steroidobacteraceae bacterium]|nr:rRNA maturation RNase YbeY [Steroidobacteraceae bacterium]